MKNTKEFYYYILPYLERAFSGITFLHETYKDNITVLCQLDYRLKDLSNMINYIKTCINTDTFDTDILPIILSPPSIPSIPSSISQLTQPIFVKKRILPIFLLPSYITLVSVPGQRYLPGLRLRKSSSDS